MKTYPDRWADGIALRYGFSDMRARFLSKSDCEVYKLDYSYRGRECAAALRIYWEDVSRVDVETEVSWLRALKCDTDLLVPEPMKALDGSIVQALPETLPPRLAVLLSWIEGEHPDEALTSVQFRKAGHVLGKIHTHSRRFMQPERAKSRRDAFLVYVENWERANVVASDAAEVLSAGAANVLKQFETFSRAPEHYGFLHGDFHPWNMLVSGGRIAAIDFSDCGWGAYAYDIATALFYFKYPLVWEQDHRKRYIEFKDAFLDGYAVERPVPENLETLQPVCFAARMLVIAQWIIDDFDHLDATPWSRYALEEAVAYLRDFQD